MGLFDFFKNKDKSAEKIDTTSSHSPTQVPFDIEFSSTSNGNLQVEFFDNEADFKNFYDITRLILSRQPFDIEGHPVYNCAVSWYGKEDCQMFDEKSGRFNSLRSLEYRGVLAEIDLDLLQNDPSYCSMVMRSLLNQKRVERYLESGLQDSPEIPCGKYIGGVRKTDEGYGKFFSMVVGRASHYSDLMVNRRREHKEMLEDRMKQAIEAKKAEIEKLQSELQSMEK